MKKVDMEERKDKKRDGVRKRNKYGRKERYQKRVEEGKSRKGRKKI
jgi:hypothetical protein